MRPSRFRRGLRDVDADVDVAPEFLIDAQRTCLQERFFAAFSFDSRDELLAAVGDMTFGVDTLAQSADSRVFVYSGWVYWFIFLRGYLEFAESGGLTADNVYLDYLTRYYGPRGHDPGLTYDLIDRERACERVERRFSLVDAATSVHPDRSWEVEPVVVVVGELPPDYPLRVFPIGSPEPLIGKLVDGWHRLFAARLGGVSSVPGRLGDEYSQVAAA